ncbi:MAG: rod shape-determining protein MreC [Sphingomonadaceae bacterium]
MAPRSKRRSGFSRKAQYSLFLGYVAAVAGIVAALLLLVVAALDPRGFGAIRGAALDATVAIPAAGRTLVRGAGNIGASVAAYLDAGSQNRALREELAASRRDLTEARAIEFENERLKRMLRLVEQDVETVAVARIVGSTFDSSRRLATLSAGRNRGIETGQPVRAPEGLIGRVLETGHFASRVLLVTDGANTVPVKMVRDGTPALSAGRGDGTVDIKPLTGGANPFAVGDIVATSGTGGLYPPNIPVAMVVKVDGDITIGRPLADPGKIDFALVQEIYQPAADGPLEDAAAVPPPPAGTDQQDGAAPTTGAGR